MSGVLDPVVPYCFAHRVLQFRRDHVFAEVGVLRQGGGRGGAAGAQQHGGEGHVHINTNHKTLTEPRNATCSTEILHARSKYHTQLARVSSDSTLHLTAECIFFHFLRNKV